MTEKAKAIQISAADNVAVCVRAVRAGDTVEVRLYKPYNNSKSYVGTLLPLDENVNIECGGQKISIPRSYVSKVNIYFDIKSIDQEEKRKK